MAFSSYIKEYVIVGIILVTAVNTSKQVLVQIRTNEKTMKIYEVFLTKMSIDLGKKVNKSSKKHGNLSYFYSYHGYDKKKVYTVYYPLNSRF